MFDKLFGKQPVLVEETKTLDDGTVAMAISVHGMILMLHLKVAAFAFDYPKTRPTEPTFGWDYKSINGVNMSVKTLAFKFVTPEDFESGNYTAPRGEKQVLALEKPQEKLS